jgi:lambda family phage portal protein
MHAATVSRAGAGTLGTMSNWTPRRLSWREESSQREKIVLRSTDIAVNDAHGSAIVDGIAINSVGTGLWPRSTPNYERLGITEEQAAEVAETAEWEFEKFAREADARGITDLYGIQYQNLWSMLVKGEFVNLPLMLTDPANPALPAPGRRYALAMQIVDPGRLRTPAVYSADPNIRDGVRLGQNGEPVSYYLANPENGLIIPGLDLSQFMEYPRSRGHRPVVLHKFVPKEPEQGRGVPIFAPVMKLFRDKNDYLDFELVAAIVAANFPVWIEKVSPYDAGALPGMQIARNLPAGQYPSPTGDPTVYHELRPGQVHYGNQGEKPHFPSSNRPSGNLPAFLETVLRAIGAGGGGMPYEIVAKDFSKTNYSSARAALEEAWRVFGFDQDWLVKVFCQIVYEMFFEEAWLRGYIKLPKGAPDFYAAKAEWCACTWTVPERTNLDPVKEMVAHIMGKQNNVATDADFCAKRGRDYEDTYKQRSRERKLAKKLELPEVGDATVSKKPETPEDPLNPQSPDTSDKSDQSDKSDNAVANIADIIAEAVRQEVKAALSTEAA